MSELGDVTRVGMLELRLKAQSIRLNGLDAKFSRLERELADIMNNQDKVADEKPLLFGFDMASKPASQPDEEAPLNPEELRRDLSAVFGLLFGTEEKDSNEDKSEDGNELIPPEIRDLDHPTCSVDVLCKDNKGKSHVGFYWYSNNEWYISSKKKPVAKDFFVSWQWLPD